MKKDKNFYQHSMLQNLEIINIGPVISILLCMIYLAYGYEFSLFSSIAISTTLISMLLYTLIFLMFKFGSSVVIEMKLNLIQVGMLGISILMPFCILSYKFFII